MKINRLLITLQIFILVIYTYQLEAIENDFLLFSGSSNYPLAHEIADKIGIQCSNLEVGKFNDGEIQIKVLENVRNRDVFIIQSTCPGDGLSVNDYMVELLLLIRTMKRSSAKTITAVIPYYGYARQDRKIGSRVPISASDIALFLEAAGVDRVVSVDLHCGQIQGFFHHVPVDNLYSSGVFSSHLIQKDLINPVIVSPDAGGIHRTKQLVHKLSQEDIASELAIIIKQRKGYGTIAEMDLMGDVTGSDVVIVDDICDTGGTLVRAAQLLKDNGANRIFAAITHPIFSTPALKRIENSVIDEVIVTNTIPLKGTLMPKNLKQVSIASLIAETIQRIHNGESVSKLF